MTDEQINAAIAEACGFVGWDEVQPKKNGPKFRFWDYPKNWHGPNQQPWVPDFRRDLNAMHEAEKVLDDQQLDLYTEILIAWHGTDSGVRATARQRAEAFLRTLGKWEDGE